MAQVTKRAQKDQNIEKTQNDPDGFLKGTEEVFKSKKVIESWLFGKRLKVSVETGHFNGNCVINAFKFKWLGETKKSKQWRKNWVKIENIIGLFWLV